MGAAVPTSLGSSCFLGSSLTGWKEWNGRELKAELWIYQSIYVTAITFDHMLWVVTERIRFCIKVVEVRLI